MFPHCEKIENTVGGRYRYYKSWYLLSAVSTAEEERSWTVKKCDVINTPVYISHETLKYPSLELACCRSGAWLEGRKRLLQTLKTDPYSVRNRPWLDLLWYCRTWIRLCFSFLCFWNRNRRIELKIYKMWGWTKKCFLFLLSALLCTQAKTDIEDRITT